MQMESKKRIKKEFVYVFLALTVCALLFAPRGSFGYTKHEISLENNMQSPGVSATIEEIFPDHSVTPGSTKQKKVHFTNNGQASVFLRMAVLGKWENAGEMLYGTQVAQHWTPAFYSEWAPKSDGWYYYKKVLPAGASTADILDSVTFSATVPAGADFILEFILEAVQVSDEPSVNESATQSLFGRKGTITNMQAENGAVVSGDVVWE